MSSGGFPHGGGLGVKGVEVKGVGVVSEGHLFKGPSITLCYNLRFNIYHSIG